MVASQAWPCQDQCLHCVSLNWLVAQSSFTRLVVLTPCILVNAIPEKNTEAVFLDCFWE